MLQGVIGLKSHSEVHSDCPPVLSLKVWDIFRLRVTFEDLHGKDSGELAFGSYWASVRFISLRAAEVTFCQVPQKHPRRT